MAAAGRSDAWFVGLNAGLLVGGALLAAANWKGWLAGLALAAGAVLAVASGAVVALLTGVLVAQLVRLGRFLPVPGRDTADHLSAWLLCPLGLLIHLSLSRTPADELAHLQSWLTPLLVLAILIVAWYRRFDVVAAMVMVLAASRPGSFALIATILIGALPVARGVAPIRVVALLAGVSLAMAAVTIIGDEVVAGVILVFSLAVLGHRVSESLPRPGSASIF